MNKDIFETTVLKLNAKLKGGEKESDEAVFIFEKETNGEKEELERITVQVKKDEWGGSAEVKNYKAPVVADDETCYGLTYRVESGNMTYPGKQVYTIWPLSVTVNAKKEGGSEAFPDAEFKITQGKKSEIVMVDSQTGQCEYMLTQKERFVIDVDFPYELIKWTEGKEKGRVLEAEVRRKSYRAAIYSPVPPEQDEALKQIVNLPPNPSQHQGHFLTVEVGPEEEKRSHVMAGDLVHVQVVFDENNSARNDPQPGLKIDGRKIDPDDRHTCKGQLTLAADGANQPFVVELGCAGGDACEIKVGVTEACEDAAFKVVNWRKLFYQVTRPERMPPPDLALLFEALEDVFIECELRGERLLGEGQGPEGSWVSGNVLGMGSGPLLVIGPHNSGYFHEQFKHAGSPLDMHFLFCDLQLDTGTDVVELTGTDSDRIDWAGEGQAPGIAYDVHTVHGDEYLAFPAALQSGRGAAYAASWKSLAVEGEHQGKGDSIPTDHVRIAFAGHEETGGRVSVKFPDAAVDVLNDGQDIRVVLSLHLALGPYPGESDPDHANRMLIAAQNLSGRESDQSICSATAHLVGHAMKMVCQHGLNVTGIDDPKTAHSQWYDTQRGHQGNHCATDISGADYNDRTKKLTGLGDQATCPMYGEPTVSKAVAYCDNCKKLIRTARLDSIR